MYLDFGNAFKKQVYEEYKDIIESIIIGAGPNG